MKDFLSDFISRINNAQRIELPETTMISFLPNKYIEILKILYDEGYIRGYKQNFNVSTQKKTITVLLKYNVRGEPIMRNLKQISRPGRRIFASTLTLWQVPSTTGIYILSTPRGIMTDNEARKYNIGGEVLLSAW